MKDRHLDTVEVFEVKSQAVLNTFKDHNFQNAFKNVRRAGNFAYERKGTTSRVRVASRLKYSV
jgi:hypothetical protein